MKKLIFLILMTLPFLSFGQWATSSAIITVAQLQDSLIAQNSTYIHTQAVPSLIWGVKHNTNRYPCTAIVDINDTVINGQITYNTLDSLTGKVYCN